MNLIPENLLFTRKRRRRAARWGCAVAALSGLLLVPVVLNWSRSAHAATLREKNDRLLVELGEARTRLSRTIAESTGAFLEIQRANALRSKRAWSALFSLIAASMPDDCWLASIATDPESPPAVARGAAAPTATSPKEAANKTVAIEAPRKLRMIGYSESDTQPLLFVTRLKETRVFDNVTLERTIRASDSAVEHSDQPIYQFEIVCEW